MTRGRIIIFGSGGKGMRTAEILEKMLRNANGNLHDINHFMSVWGYARTIGEMEGLDADTQFVLEVAAITHDIACPVLRERDGNTNHRHQETEGAPMVREFLADTGLSTAQLDRVAYLVGHHHTLEGIDGMDYQILIEADYIVNASEKGYSKENVRNFINRYVKTEAGKRITRTVFGT